ncbi:MAG TPA: 2-oxoglutarate oxidoreductase [Anaerolineae bacterium]|nr:2-oxoglutarate oxidoreductase [Anaerolineae bacterium]
MLEATLIKPENIVYQRPHALADVPTIYCPGCTHGLIHKLIAEVIDDLGIREDCIHVSSVGCSVFAYKYFDMDGAEAAHGRAPAMATGIKRVHPDRIVWTYQGDGDLAAIGTAEVIHAASRGEQITVFFVNNAIYGMTGGQMAPTTLPGQVTTSSPTGRNVKLAGYPIRMIELIAELPGVAYAVRRTVVDIPNIKKAKTAIRTAFLAQMHGLGFSMVEFLSTCPTGWRMSPVEALEWLKENMASYYPLGDYKITDAVKELMRKDRLAGRDGRRPSRQKSA